MNYKSKCFIVLVMIFSCSTLFAIDEALQAALNMQKVFTSVASQLKPSVVNIRIERESSAGIRWTTPDGKEAPDELEGFFKHFFRAPGFRFQPEPKFKSEAAGSGVVIAAEGIILTNNHVVKDASKILVRFYNGDEYEAEIVGQDPQTDLAVIKIEGKSNFKPAKFADSDKVEVGQWAIAVGNPLGLEQTVTVGVVSALGRSGIGATTIEDFIQTDASINPGNSGGPLVDLNGKVIGINTLIFNAPGSGIGFAIPSNMAHRISRQIADQGRVVRPYIGITMQPVTDQLMNHYGLKSRDGAVVLQLIEDAPAAKAGLKPMDIIVKIDGNQMRSTSDVQKFVLNQDMGKELEVEILREGKSKSITIKLEEMPESFGLAQADIPTARRRSSTKKDFDKLGLSVKEITPEIAKRMGIGEVDGLVIDNIRNGSPAAEAGLRSGDLITQVNGKSIESESDLESALGSSAKKDSSVFLVRRGATPMFLIVPHELED